MDDIERGDDVEAPGTQPLLFRWKGNIVRACGDVRIRARTCSGVGESNRDVANNILADEVVFPAQKLCEVPRQGAGTFRTTSNRIERGKTQHY